MTRHDHTTSPELWDKLRQIRWEHLADLPTEVASVMLEAADFVEAAMSQPQSPADEVERLRSAAQFLSDRAFTRYRDGDDLTATIEGDDGEICFIVPFDEMIELRAALSAIRNTPQAIEAGEVERLREALELCRERFNDLAKITDEMPWKGYELGGGFMLATARRIDRVLAGASFNDDLCSALSTQGEGR